MANFNELLEQVSIVMDNDDNYITEGANLEIRKHYKRLRQKYKELNKDIKLYTKNGEKRKAIKAIDEYLKLLKETREAIDNTPDNLASVIIGYFYENILDSFEITLTTLLTFPLFGAGGFLDAIRLLVMEISGMVRQYKNEGGFSIEILNLRRAKINSVIDEMERTLNKTKKMLQLEADDVKESAYEEDLKLEIYESCYYGDITEEERDILLDLI